MDLEFRSFRHGCGQSQSGGCRGVRLQPAVPGQVFDGQVGLHYNYSRDYDPAVGSYVESDPIGLSAGVDTYAYVADSPSMEYDDDGLEAVSYLMHQTAWEQYVVTPPNLISPEVKKYLCNLVNQCNGDWHCVFNKANAARNHKSPNGRSDPKTWKDPILRDSENFAAAAADVLPYAYTSHNMLGITAYQFLVKLLYHVLGDQTTPISADTWKAGLNGRLFYETPQDDAKRWCDGCLQR